MIWCLHGFLGQGADWEFLGENAGLQTPVKAPSLFSPDNSGSLPSLQAWSRAFCSKVKAEDASPTLIAYSLGGRLGLHALLEEPDLFQKAVMIAAHTGLSDRNDREIRRAHDGRWADRFLREPWDDLLESWESQPVFGGRKTHLPRAEESYSRKALASALRDWSLGAQEDLLPRLGEIRSRILWVVGEEDQKYRNLAKPAVASLARGSLFVCPAACHRVPWESSDLFIDRVKIFLSE